MQAKRKQVHYEEIEKECGKTVHALTLLCYYPKHGNVSIQSGFVHYGKRKNISCTYSSKIIVNGV